MRLWVLSQPIPTAREMMAQVDDIISTALHIVLKQSIHKNFK